MRFSLLGYEIKIGKKSPLHQLGNTAKREQSWQKIREALERIEAADGNFTFYNIAKVSGASRNTVKKYRNEIEAWRKSRAGLFG